MQAHLCAGKPVEKARGSTLRRWPAAIFAAGWLSSLPLLTWLWVKTVWYHFGVVAPLILEPIFVGIGMFTGGTGF